MTFLKIDDPSKRDQLVKEYLSLRNKIHDDQITEKMGETFRMEEIEKTAAPITKSNERTQKLLEEQNKIFQEALDQKINTPAIENPDGSIIDFGPLSLEYITTAQNKKKDYDSTFGINIKDNKIMLGDTIIEINKDDIVVDNKRYEGTKGLWELLTRQQPNKNVITDDDIKNYEEITLNTNNLFIGDKIKGNKRGIKYTSFLKPIIERYYPSKLKRFPSITQSPRRSLPETPTGKGINIITLPCDPNVLFERMDLLFESKKAGNNNVERELTAIIDKLYKDKIIDKNARKRLILQL